MARRSRSHDVAGTTQASRLPSRGLSAHIKRGILSSFDPATYTAGVLLLEATTTYLQGVPLAYHMDGTSALANNLCAVLFFDAQNYTDAVILAIYPGSGVGAPSYPPGRVTFVPMFTLVNGVTINNGVTNTYTVTGSNNIPASALGVLIHAYFTSANAGSWVDLTSHGGANDGFTMGNLYANNGFVNQSGIVKVDSSGKLDIKANAANCVVTARVWGYII